MNNKKILIGCSLSTLTLAVTPNGYWGSSPNAASLSKSIAIVLVVLIFLMLDIMGQYIKDLAGYPAKEEIEVLEGELLPPEPASPVEPLPTVERVMPGEKSLMQTKLIDHKKPTKLILTV